MADSIFKDKSNIGQKFIFLPKFGPQDKKSLTFEPLDGFSKFKSLNALKFHQEFNKNIISPGSVDPDPKTDPDPAKKGRIHGSGSGSSALLQRALDGRYELWIISTEKHQSIT